MNILEIAKIIANEIDSNTEEQLDAMVQISAKTHGVDWWDLTRAIQNIYHEATRNNRPVTYMQHEPDPR